MSSPVANLSKPTARKATSTKPEPPAAAEIHNLHKPTSSANTQLQFQVPPEIRRAVKAHAAENDINLSALFLRMWEVYKRTNP